MCVKHCFLIVAIVGVALIGCDEPAAAQGSYGSSHGYATAGDGAGSYGSHNAQGFLSRRQARVAARRSARAHRVQARHSGYAENSSAGSYGVSGNYGASYVPYQGNGSQGTSGAAGFAAPQARYLPATRSSGECPFCAGLLDNQEDRIVEQANRALEDRFVFHAPERAEVMPVTGGDQFLVSLQTAGSGGTCPCGESCDCVDCDCAMN